MTHEPSPTPASTPGEDPPQHPPGSEAPPAAEPSPPIRIEFDIATGAILKVGAAILSVWLFTKVWPVVVLLILSLMLFATFNPLVRRLQERLNRAWAITAVTLGIVAVGTVLLVMMIPPLVRQARNLLVHLPEYAVAMESAARKTGMPIKLAASAKAWTAQVSSLGPQLIQVFSTVLSGITGVMTVAVLTIYLLIDGPRVGTVIMRTFPRDERLPIRRMLAEIGTQVGSYMRGQMITSGLAGVFALGILLVFKVPEPLALAFLMALTDAIPMVGPLIGTVPAVMMALTKGTPTAMAVAVAYVIYNQIENHFIIPRVYGGAMKLPPSVILIAILVGATLMGILGAVLALPVAAAVPVVMRFVDEWRERQAEGVNPMPQSPP
jgi:predicted PurR-regulated permease PerM